MAALALAGCGKPGDPALSTAVATSSPSTVVVASTVDMRGVNELVVDATTFHTGLHYYAFFLTLLDEAPDFEDGAPTFRPRLAESYEFSDDRRAVTFALRRDAVWSDGRPVTAEDVRWTWQAQTHPDVAWRLASYKSRIRDVVVVDAHTVRFELESAYATQLVDVNLGVVLPKHAWSRLPFSQWRTAGNWFLENLVVAGPFDLESWEPGERLVLRRNPHYFRSGRPRSERIVFRIAADRAAQLALLRSGQAHFADAAQPSDAALLADEADIEILSYLPRGSRVLVWNVEHPLFAEKDVRLALTLGLDRQAIVETLYYGYANVTDSLLPSNVWARHRELPPRPYDPDRARRLLARHGWRDSDGDGVLERGGRPFRFEILTAAGHPLRQDVLVMVQDQLARLGVGAGQRAIELNTLFGRERNHDFEASLTSMAVGTDLDLSFFLHSSAIDGGYNLSSYSSLEVDHLLDTLRARQDPVAAKPLYDRLQTLIYDDVPVTPLFEPWHLVPVRVELLGVSPNALSPYFDLEEWRLDRRD